MKIIEPTHKEIMQYLNCCYYTRWHKGECECSNRKQFKSCYEHAKKQLTQTEYTEEEIRKHQKQNTKAMAEINKALRKLFD